MHHFHASQMSEINVIITASISLMPYERSRAGIVGVTKVNKAPGQNGQWDTSMDGLMAMREAN